MTTTTQSTSRHATALPILAALVTVVLWASAFVAIRHVGHDVSAGPLSLGRLFVASLTLGLVLLYRQFFAVRQKASVDAIRFSAPSRQAWFRILTVGVLWFGIYNVALNEAEQRIDAGTASMLINIGPILIAILAGLFLHEGFPRQLVIGGLIAFTGVVIIGLATSSGGSSDTVGVLLCVLSAVAYAIAVIVQKPLLAKLSALQVTWLACTVGLVVCLPFAPTLVREVAASPSSVWWIVYLGVLPTAVAFTTWAYALARTSAGKLGVTTYLVPPLTILMGWALLGETPALLAFAGGALCLVGVAVARRRSSR